MPRKLPYLSSLAGTIDKLVHETEAEAKSIVEKEVLAVRQRKDEVMGQARKQLDEHRETVDDLGKQLDQVAEALGDNSSDPK
jgi:vacuolar-type H+-ATPase subunit H